MRNLAYLPKKDISQNLRNELSQGDIRFLYRYGGDNRSGDADIYLHLIYKNEPLAKMGVSLGLENYYRGDDFGGLDFFKDRDPSVLDAVKNAKGKWGVTLMQSFSGKKSLREELSSKEDHYSNLLMKKMNSLPEIFNFPIEFYLPGRLVFWNLNSFSEYFSPSSNGINDVFRENYDSVAERFGFKLLDDESLYVR